jgi:hypothetical protein
MASLLSSLGDLFDSGAVQKLSGMLGADPSAITKGLGAAGPLILGGLAKSAGAPGGVDMIQKMIPKEGLLGGIGGLMSMISGGGPGAMLGSLLGPGSNAIGAALSKAIGFNVTPLLGVVAPALLGVLGKTMKEKNVDGSGLAAMLKGEHDAFSADPANAGTMQLVTGALSAGKDAEALVTSYGAEWESVTVAPAAALMAVASSDMSGPVGTMKEAKAASDTLKSIAGAASPSSLLAAAFNGGIEKDMLDALRKFAGSKDAVFDAVAKAMAAVKAKSPSEAAAFGSMIVAVATAAAEASKEGGFLGIGGTLVSDDERVAIDRLKKIVA